VPDQKGTGRHHHQYGRAPDGKIVRLDPEQFPHKAYDSAKQVSCRPALCIELVETVDMDDGQPLPPLIEDAAVWHVVGRAGSRTLWRRLFLSSSSVTPGAASPEDQSRAPRGPK
jgi:hypothetical protein